MTKTLLALSDLHVGNEGAIMTEEVNSEDISPGRNRRYFANPIQKDLIKKWYEMCDECPRPDILLLNGDLVDGRNYKDTGLGCWTTDVSLQTEVVADLVSMLKPRQIVGTTGSPYHSDRNPNMDKLAIERCGGIFKGGYASLKFEGKRIHAQHKIAVSKSSWQYRTTPVARSLVLAALQEEDYGHYDIVLRGHAHYFTYAGFSSALGMILPCWKSYDPFGDTNIEFNSPALGWVRFDFNGSDYRFTFNINHHSVEILNADVVA